MALEVGGYADKLGNRYESNWVAHLLLELLEEKLCSVTLEPIGDDEVGVDVVVERNSGNVEYYQCKASNSNDEYWSFPKLNAAGILKKALYQIRRGTNKFYLVSPLSSENLRKICGSSLNSNGNTQDFVKYQVNVGEKRKKDFSDFCRYAGIELSTDEGLNEAYNLLKRIEVIQYCDDVKELGYIEQRANALYMGEPSKLVLFLKYYAVEQNRLRQKITLPQLLDDIRCAEFERRLVPEDTRVAPVIERISTNFVESIQPYLIQEQLISRPESQDIIEATERVGIVLIKAAAGMGKSVTLLEIHNSLRASSAVSLPIRLDRNRPEANADTFGKALGFMHSPIYCIQSFAHNQKCFVILDQLDAVRWTASHSNNALEVCKELVRQTLSLRKSGVDISIILACRDFEIDEDPALRGWIDSISDDVKEVSLGELNSALVAEKVGSFESYESLTTEKQNVLKIPLWLGIYLSIATRDQCAPAFSSKIELVQKFWANKYADIEALGIETGEINLVLDEILQIMSDESRLSVPEICISAQANKAKEALISVGVLAKNSGQISFRHQALLDYKLGKRLFDAANISNSELLGKIGDKPEQTLTKREHLRYALSMLLSVSQKRFCTTSLVILGSDKVRFHIKHLVLNALKEITRLTSASKSLIDTLIDNDELGQNFLAVSCYGHSEIVSYLSSTGRITDWLTSDNEASINQSIWLLRSVAEIIPEIVIRELSPFTGKSSKWNQRVRGALCWNMEDDSDAMFELRKELLNDETIEPFINWQGLAKRHPDRVIQLIELLLNYYREDIAAPYLVGRRKNKKGFAHRDKWSESDIAAISEANATNPELVLSKLLGIVHEFGKDGVEANRNWLDRNNLGLSDTISNLTRGTRSLIYKAAKSLVEDNPASLVSVVEVYLVQDTLLMNYLNAKILLQLPVEYADFVIEWILKAPENRLSCGNDNVEPRWLLPAKLVEKFASHCSSKNLNQLEKSVLNQGASVDIQSVKWKLEARRRGYFPSYWGEAQFFILPKLSHSNISEESRQLIAILRRKFKGYTYENFCSAHNLRGGRVTSPLDDPNKLSDRAWSKLINSSQTVDRGGCRTQYGKDAVIEASVEQFARSLHSATRNEPARFAKLALSLPTAIDIRYLENLYWGLSEKDDKQVGEPFKRDWCVCPPKLIEAVIAHFGKTRCVSAVMRLLHDQYSENGKWSVDTRDLIIEIAESAESPAPNKLFFSKDGVFDKADEANTHDLEGTMINCDRGIAYRKIGDLFWRNEKLSRDLRYLIQSAIDDPHPAVSLAGISMILPICNRDESFALTTFLKLCSKDLRASTARGTHYFFNNGFEAEHQQQYIALVLAMLESSYRDIREEGARQVFARWYFNNLFSAEIDKVLNGEDAYREGVAAVVEQFAKDGKYQYNHDKLSAVFGLLVNDESKEVRSHLANAVRDEGFWQGILAKNLFRHFVTSKAALDDLWSLFNTIDRHVDNLLEYRRPLFELIENITDNSNGDIRMNISDSSLISVLQRLYDQAVEDESEEAINLCLDIWDKLLASDIYSVVSTSNGLEKGLLS